MFHTGIGTLGRQVFGSRQLFEVVVDVFANHLHVATPSDRGWDVAPQYAISVIRRHAFGKFSDMLQAAMRHPAMLRFLDNDASTRDSVNENLGRELLELHTVGVSSGYTEKDVRASAYVLSGRGATPEGKFEYVADKHRTGRVKVLGWSASNGSAKGGLATGDRYLDYLAKHPATARTIARKLVVRFVDDSPPAGLVNHLAEVYLKNNTAILPVLTALFRSGSSGTPLATRRNGRWRTSSAVPAHWTCRSGRRQPRDSKPPTGSSTTWAKLRWPGPPPTAIRTSPRPGPPPVRCWTAGPPTGAVHTAGGRA